MDDPIFIAIKLLNDLESSLLNTHLRKASQHLDLRAVRDAFITCVPGGHPPQHHPPQPQPTPNQSTPDLPTQNPPTPDLPTHRLFESCQKYLPSAVLLVSQKPKQAIGSLPSEMDVRLTDYKACTNETQRLRHCLSQVSWFLEYHQYEQQFSLLKGSYFDRLCRSTDNERVTPSKLAKFQEYVGVAYSRPEIGKIIKNGALITLAACILPPRLLLLLILLPGGNFSKRELSTWQSLQEWLKAARFMITEPREVITETDYVSHLIATVQQGSNGCSPKPREHQSPIDLYVYLREGAEENWLLFAIREYEVQRLEQSKLGLKRKSREDYEEGAVRLDKRMQQSIDRHGEQSQSFPPSASQTTFPNEGPTLRDFEETFPASFNDINIGFLDFNEYGLGYCLPGDVLAN